MARVKFALDENRSPRLRSAILRREPEIDIVRIGDPGCPPLGTLDPEVLRYLEQSARLLITDNRISMPRHVAAHHAADRHHWGILRIRPGTTMAQEIDEIILIWRATDAEEWKDQFGWLPL